MTATRMLPQSEQWARDLLEDLGLIISEIGSAAGASGSAHPNEESMPS